MPNKNFVMAIGLCSVAGFQVSPALAAEDRDGNPIVQIAAPSKVSGSSILRTNPLGIAPVDSKTLASKRGGTNVANEMVLNGVVAENRASNLATGNNIITDGAFANSVGLPVVIQNSGNGVLIQNATIVNVQVK